MKITIKGGEKLREVLSRYPKVAKKNLSRAAETSGRMIESDAKRRAPVDQGSLRQSIDTYPRGMSATVEAGVKYAPYVEFGRPPGKQPPISSVERWSKKRGIEPFLVARKIGRFGTKPQPFFEPAIQKNKDNIRKEFEDAVKKTLREL